MTDLDEQNTRRVITDWVNQLAAELDAAEAPVDVDEILAIAGTAAHSVLRPAAPLTTYLLGYVAGRAGDNSTLALEDALKAVRRLAAQRGPSQRE